ncbi:hypothetical protein [Plantibacter sp. VKM Ac-2876]|uniref:hypothetical protein n=1 Tax=Plantibacter sp. VKM Ac-2876 TaxID=2783826 RepID=UPI00188C2148|nr:hypothetical protein [Plantibacter sp. VKM Ac-2876]MBF4565973.1 hypothetical protein [Plantibacter sp. VKM Ac-2876]
MKMAYFRTLDRRDFDHAIDEAVKAQRCMVEVTNLNDWEGKQGLYIMALDEFKQAYVDITHSDGGIKSRVRQHWSTSKAFDRPLRGRVTESIISIDSFRALDTTRIFAARARDPFALEDKVINSIPSEFMLNRVMGGDGRLVGLGIALGADAMKRRAFESQSVD